MKKIFPTLSLLAALITSNVKAQPNLQESISEISHNWAAISYQTPEPDRESAFNALAISASEVTATFPDKAEPLIWQAIVLSSEAKAEGGLGALSKVKEARWLLIKAEKIDAAALDGSIYGSLGSLYAKVPGWPVGFGDKKKAVEYFQKALAINPHSIDVNYFYADLLADQGDYKGAVKHLKMAIAAPPRADRADADAGRRQEAQQMLETLMKKHADTLSSI